MVALLGLLGDRLQNHGLDGGRDLGINVARRWRWLVDNGVEGGVRCGSSEGYAPDEHLVKNDPQRIEVGAVINLRTPGLFWRHVLWCAHQHAGARKLLRLCSRLGDAKIGQGDMIALAHKDVGRLDIAMHKALSMGIVQGSGDLFDDVRCPVGRQRTLLLDDLLQGMALEILHDDIVDAVLVPDVVDDDDIGVAQSSSGLSFSLEALDELLIVAELGWKRLDGHVTVEGWLIGAVDNGHATPPELVDDLVIANGFAC